MSEIHDEARKRASQIAQTELEKQQKDVEFKQLIARSSKETREYLRKFFQPIVKGLDAEKGITVKSLTFREKDDWCDLEIIISAGPFKKTTHRYCFERAFSQNSSFVQPVAGDLEGKYFFNTPEELLATIKKNLVWPMTQLMTN